MSGSSDGSGYLNPHDFGHEFNQQIFLMKQLMGRTSTVKLVKIISCTNSGGVSPVGTVNVQPMVKQVDGAGVAQSHGTAYNLSYFRLQGGSDNAVIMDPVAGDLGFAIIADRDTSSALSANGEANPGSARRFSMSDGHYIGGYVQKVTPKNYVQFAGSGVINIVGASEVKVSVGDMVADVTTANVKIGNKNGPFYPIVTTGGNSTYALASVP